MAPASPDDGEERTNGAVLGLEASVVMDPIVVEKLAQAFLHPDDKKMEGRMELDEVVTQSYHAYNQVNKFERFYLAFISFAIKVLI